jgi:opacity protein-like surface antigen
MRRLILLAAVAALFLVALPVASAVAAPPEQVTFGGEAFFSGSQAGFGDFRATGPAVDSGATCKTGLTEDLVTTTRRTPQGVNLQILKEFTCDDVSGTFQVRLQVRIPSEQLSTFHWVVVGGTGDYEDLKGNGSGFAVAWLPAGSDFSNAIGVIDVYEGKLH